MKLKLIPIMFFVFFGVSFFIWADDEEGEVLDGTYDAEVITPSGTYAVPVEVSGGEVDCVEWPNGGCMHLFGAEIDSNGEATGTNSAGDLIEIHIEN